MVGELRPIYYHGSDILRLSIAENYVLRLAGDLSLVVARIKMPEKVVLEME